MASNINPATINITYPIAGQDNDTQGFRSNFQNIQTNFITAASEISALQGNVTLTSAIQFANLTTTQVNAITPTAIGMTVYNYTTGNIQVYNGTKWANVTLS